MPEPERSGWARMMWSGKAYSAEEAREAKAAKAKYARAA
jgi:hypothetical protein